ncbi:MAG: heme utilization cystosolic carrier protein HutX [Hyphomicrobiaceae bacterium]|nr:heme utilization cystosolic carrier protein HutX [Hyphomicrobiaceae bacterium]
MATDADRTPAGTGIAAVKAALAEKPDGVLESLAETHGVSYRAVLDCLPAEQRRAAAAGAFDAIWQDLTTWGTVMLIVHTVNGVFETKAPLPPGEHGRGYFNIHGDSPIGGHLRIGRCAAIYFVDRPFFGRRSCSIQLVDTDGEAMFKVFVARNAQRELVPEQVRRFEMLRSQHA